tara:strand:- start:223 stop:1206 length:984 start_codon:yes stop_codon:yes gene_type:complete
MTTYKEVFGKYVRSVSSDPPATLGEGEIWYNTSSNTFKTVGFNFAWSSGGGIPSGGYGFMGAGTQTAGLLWGGRSGPIYSATAEYNGSSWTGGGDYPQAIVEGGGTGTQTAALAVGGLNPASPPAYTNGFEYNGSSWGSEAALGRQGFGVRLNGTQASAVATGGGPTGGSTTTDMELYNGSSYTAGSSFSQTRSFHASGGSSETSSIIVGGRKNPGEASTNSVETLDGTSWTTATVYPTTIKENQGWGAANDFIEAGGNVPGITTACNVYNGTSWTSTAAMSNGRSSAGTSANFSSSIGFIAGGSPGSPSLTEEFTGTAAVQTVTTS